MSVYSSSPEFGRAETRSALVDLINALESPANAQRLDQARLEAGNSMVRQMQIVFPIVAKIQAEVISRYGFPSNGPGSVQFIQNCKLHATEDPEVARLFAIAKEYFVPPVHNFNR